MKYGNQSINPPQGTFPVYLYENLQSKVTGGFLLNDNQECLISA